MNRLSVIAALLVMTLALTTAGCGKDKPATGLANSPVGGAKAELITQVLADPEFERACEETPGCADPPRYEAPGAAEIIWRVLVVRDASKNISIDLVEPVQVPEDDGVPVGPLSGTHQLVGLDSNGQPVDGQLIRFPEWMRVEYEPTGPAPSRDGAGAERGQELLPREIEEIDLSGQPVSTVGFVRALSTVQSIAVRDESGATVAEAKLPAAIAQAHSSRRFEFINSALAQSGQQPVWPYQGNIPPYCAHVLILEGEMDAALAQGIAYEDEIVELVVPGPRQRAAIFAALRKMTPMLCQSIRRIALAELKPTAGFNGAVRDRGTGDMMLINAGGNYSESSLSGSSWYYYRLRMMGTIYHEAGHAADALINSQGSLPEDFAGDWDLPARTMASNTIARVRLEKGLRNEWRRFHESFMELGWAAGHQMSEQAKAAVYDWTPRQVNDAGFMSHYGATSPWDDIAETVEWTYVTQLYVQEGWAGQWSDDFACQEMRDYAGSGLPSRFTAVYTKLMFLKDLGLVAEEDVESCMGSEVGLPINAGGFHFWHDGNMLRSFDRNLTAGIGAGNDGSWVFEMEAEGEASFAQEMYPAKLELRIGVDSPGVPVHRVAWPRGVYKLGLLGNNTVRLRLDGASAGDFDVKDGFVLVAEASNERIAGSIFVTVAMRFGAPLPVPQTWNPPLVIRFLIEH